MDPNVTLAILRQTIAEFRALIDEVGDVAEPRTPVAKLVDLGDTLAESAGALDEWMSKGGFRPVKWCTHDPSGKPIPGIDPPYY